MSWKQQTRSASKEPTKCDSYFSTSLGKGVQADKLLTENVIFGEKILEIEQALKWYTTITYYNNADPWKTGLKWCCITFAKPCIYINIEQSTFKMFWVVQGFAKVMQHHLNPVFQGTALL